MQNKPLCKWKLEGLSWRGYAQQKYVKSIPEIRTVKHDSSDALSQEKNQNPKTPFCKVNWKFTK